MRPSFSSSIQMTISRLLQVHRGKLLRRHYKREKRLALMRIADLKLAYLVPEVVKLNQHTYPFTVGFQGDGLHNIGSILLTALAGIWSGQHEAALCTAEADSGEILRVIGGPSVVLHPGIVFCQDGSHCKVNRRAKC